MDDSMEHLDSLLCKKSMRIEELEEKITKLEAAITDWKKEEALWKEHEAELLEDSQRLDRLLGSGRLRYATAIDYQVCLSHRYVIDEVLSHIDEQGKPADDWFDNLPKAEEKTLWPKEENHE